MGSFIAGLIVDIFNAIGKALAGAFMAELGLVQKFINEDTVVFGGNFNSLIKFNAIIIPALATLVFLIWLVAKGLTGGNSKSSTEDMLKRSMGSMVISLVLSLIVTPVESLIGALDKSLMSLVNVNSQGLQHTFAGIATLSAIGGIEDSIFISIVVLFLGLVLAGMLILILILAHAAVFLLVYFAPYLTLFRKDGFREAVEGVTAALSMPFIVTSILAVGIATMGATGVGSSTPAALGAGTTTLSGMVSGHLVTQSIQLMGGHTVDAVTYFSNAIGGLLILAAAIVLPKFILGMAFQAGAAMHEALRSSHSQLGDTVTNKAKEGLTDKKGSASKLLHRTLGTQDPATQVTGSANPGIDRKTLADQALTAGGTSFSNVKTTPTGGPSITGKDAATKPSLPQPPVSSDESSASPDPNRPHSPYDTLNEWLGPVDGEQAAGGEPTVPLPVVPPENPGGPLAIPDGVSNTDGDKGNGVSKPLTTRAANRITDHYKGTVRAIPQAFSEMPRIASADPVKTSIEARAAWRAAKRQNIHQVREERNKRESESAPPPPPPPPPSGPDSPAVPSTQGPTGSDGA